MASLVLHWIAAALATKDLTFSFFKPISPSSPLDRSDLGRQLEFKENENNLARVSHVTVTHLADCEMARISPQGYRRAGYNRKNIRANIMYEDMLFFSNFYTIIFLTFYRNTPLMFMRYQKWPNIILFYQNIACEFLKIPTTL